MTNNWQPPRDPFETGDAAAPSNDAANGAGAGSGPVEPVGGAPMQGYSQGYSQGSPGNYSQGYSQDYSQPDPRTGQWLHTKPGIIPIRPLRIGEIVGGSFSMLRYNFLPLITISLLFGVILVPVTIIGAILAFFILPGGVNPEVSLSADNVMSFSRTWSASALLSIVNVIFPFFAAPLAYVVSGAVRGEKIGTREAFRIDKGAFGQLFVLGVIFAAATALISTVSEQLSELAFNNVGFLFLSPLVSIALSWLNLIIQVKMVHGAIIATQERHPLGLTLKRAWSLSNRRPGALFGGTALLGLIGVAGIIGFTVLLMLLIGGLFIITSSSSAESAAPAIIITLLLVVLFVLLAALIFLPIIVSLSTLMYFDARFATEGMDIELLAGSPAGGAPSISGGSGFSGGPGGPGYLDRSDRDFRS